MNPDQSANQKKFTAHTMDWRAQLKKNEKRTRFVIIAFFLIYLIVGFLIDLLIYTTWFYQYSTTEVAKAIITLQLIPYGTITMVGVAVISLFITYNFYDKMILLGTNHKQINPEGENTLEEKQLYNVVEEMKVAAGLQFMPKVFVIEANYMNAFASGYSEKSAMVAITRGLLQKLKRDELQAVMAHELSHIRHHDIKLTLMTSVLSNIMLIAIDLIFYNLLFGNRRNTDTRMVAIILILRYVLPLITVVLMLYLSRTREYMADAGCVELMRNNEPLARALVKIHEDHQQNRAAYREEYGQTSHEDVRRASYLYDPVKAGVEPVMSINSLFSTHPSLSSRLKAIGIKLKND